jgi:hypothetical protein
VPDQPGWALDFDVENGKVTSFLLLNSSIRCGRA